MNEKLAEGKSENAAREASVSAVPARFSREEWAGLRADQSDDADGRFEVMQLQSLNDPISLDEVIAIYLPLSRLLSLYVAATQGLFRAHAALPDGGKTSASHPISSAWRARSPVGKSTTARVLKGAAGCAGRTRPRSIFVTTDGFLLPNAELRRQGLMERKGFPESYDTGKLLRFSQCHPKSGRAEVARTALFAPRLRRGAWARRWLIDSPPTSSSWRG